MSDKHRNGASEKVFDLPYENGIINPGHNCPWNAQCGDARNGDCYRPMEMSRGFSCGYARLFYVITGGVPNV